MSFSVSSFRLLSQVANLLTKEEKMLSRAKGGLQRTTPSEIFSNVPNPLEYSSLLPLRRVEELTYHNDSQMVAFWRDGEGGLHLEGEVRRPVIEPRTLDDHQLVDDEPQWENALQDDDFLGLSDDVFPCELADDSTPNRLLDDE